MGWPVWAFVRGWSGVCAAATHRLRSTYTTTPR